MPNAFAASTSASRWRPLGFRLRLGDARALRQPRRSRSIISLPDQFDACSGDPSPFWDTFARHDSGWYFEHRAQRLRCATAVAGGRSNIAFFPVYPLLMRYVGRPVRPRSTAISISAASSSRGCPSSLAMVALYLPRALDLPRRRAERAVLLTAIFPFAFFFGVVYTESTFLLFTVLAFYGFRTRRWMLGGVVRRVGDRDAGDRHPDVAGAGVDRVARRPKPTRRDRLGAAAGARRSRRAASAATAPTSTT